MLTIIHENDNPEENKEENTDESNESGTEETKDNTDSEGKDGGSKEGSTEETETDDNSDNNEVDNNEGNEGKDDNGEGDTTLEESTPNNDQNDPSNKDEENPNDDLEEAPTDDVDETKKEADDEIKKIDDVKDVVIIRDYLASESLTLDDIALYQLMNKCRFTNEKNSLTVSREWGLFETKMAKDVLPKGNTYSCNVLFPDLINEDPDIWYNIYELLDTVSANDDGGIVPDFSYLHMDKNYFPFDYDRVDRMTEQDANLIIKTVDKYYKMQMDMFNKLKSYSNNPKHVKEEYYVVFEDSDRDRIFNFSFEPTYFGVSKDVTDKDVRARVDKVNDYIETKLKDINKTWNQLAKSIFSKHLKPFTPGNDVTWDSIRKSTIGLDGTYAPGIPDKPDM